jgi:hypothetical protein
MGHDARLVGRRDKITHLEVCVLLHDHGNLTLEHADFTQRVNHIQPIDEEGSRFGGSLEVQVSALNGKGGIVVGNSSASEHKPAKHPR